MTKARIYTIQDKKVEFRGISVAQCDVDAIVCPANPNLTYDFREPKKSIVELGGSEIFTEAESKARSHAAKNGVHEQHGFPGYLGSWTVMPTNAGDLPAKNVLHVVCYGSEHIEDIRKSKTHYKNTVEITTEHVLKKAIELGYNSIAFPILGKESDIPIKVAIPSMCSEISSYLERHTSLDKVVLATTDEEFDRTMQSLWAKSPVEPDTARKVFGPLFAYYCLTDYITKKGVYILPRTISNKVGCNIFQNPQEDDIHLPSYNGIEVSFWTPLNESDLNGTIRLFENNHATLSLMNIVMTWFEKNGEFLDGLKPSKIPDAAGGRMTFHMRNVEGELIRRFNDTKNYPHSLYFSR